METIVEETVKNISFSEWQKKLISVTSAETGVPENTIKLNETGCRFFYDNGWTPYYTFREMWGVEDDCHI